VGSKSEQHIKGLVDSIHALENELSQLK